RHRRGFQHDVLRHRGRPGHPARRPGGGAAGPPSGSLRSPDGAGMNAAAAGAPPSLTVRWKTWALTLVPLALVVPLLVSNQPLHYAWGTSAAIWALWVLSLNIVWGYVGLLSLAQLSLGAMTAYTV